MFHKRLNLRHPLDKNSQVYDFDGNVQTAGNEGPWTLYGRIRVMKITINKNALHLEGERLIYSFNPQNGLAPSGHQGNVKVEIHLLHPIVSAEEANTLMGRVFALSDDEMIRSVPALWQPYL